MNNINILNDIKKLSDSEKINIPYNDLIEIINKLDENEIIELSKIIGYPIFARMCMGDLKHKFILLQDGASAIITNKKGQILFQLRSDNNKWGLPGGCQELGEKLQDTLIREIKEETNLDVLESDLELISVVSGINRKNIYPNGDIVINNTALYLVKKYSGKIKSNYETKKFRFFDLNNLPVEQNDPDLVEEFKKYLNKIY